MRSHISPGIGEEERTSKAAGSESFADVYNRNGGDPSPMLSARCSRATYMPFRLNRSDTEIRLDRLRVCRGERTS